MKETACLKSLHGKELEFSNNQKAADVAKTGFQMLGVGGNKGRTEAGSGVWRDQLGCWQGHLRKRRVPGEDGLGWGEGGAALGGALLRGISTLVLTISNLIEWHPTQMHPVRRFYQALCPSSSRSVYKSS